MGLVKGHLCRVDGRLRESDVMSREKRRTEVAPPLWWFVIYGICGGLIVTSLAILISKGVYGSWDLTSHALSIVILGVLVLAGCWVANPVLTWFARLVHEARRSVDTDDVSPRRLPER